MNRRHFLGIAAGASGVVALGGGAGWWASQKPEKPEPEKFDFARAADALTRYLSAENPDHLILGDTDHNRIEDFCAFLADERVMKFLQNNGWRHIGIELRYEIQSVLDGIVRDKITADAAMDRIIEFYRERDFYLNTREQIGMHRGWAELALQADKFGIALHAVEAQAADMVGHAQLGAWEGETRAEFIRALEEMRTPGDEVKENIRTNLRSLFDSRAIGEYFRKRVAAKNDLYWNSDDPRVQRFRDFIKGRTDGDLALAAKFLERTMSGGRTLLLYGQGHGSRLLTDGPDINEMLPGKVLRVALCRTEMDIIEVMEYDNHSRWDKHNAYLVLETGRLIIMPKQPEPNLMLQPDSILPG